MAKIEEELRYAKEALAIVQHKHETSNIQHPVLEAQKELLPLEFQYLADFSPMELREYVERLESDIEDKNGGWL